MEILRIKEVAKRTALSPSSIYKQIRLGNFPKGTKITTRATGWSNEDIENWIADKLKVNKQDLEPGEQFEKIHSRQLRENCE
jgi:prophage regulatory protein